MKVKELQQELRKRNLDTKGLKKDLRARLIKSMEEELAGSDVEMKEEIMQAKTAPKQEVPSPESQPEVQYIQMVVPSKGDQLQVVEQNSTGVNIDQEEIKVVTSPMQVSPTKKLSPKRSRSPFRVVQSKVQSAIKIFSAKKKSPYRQVSNDDEGSFAKLDLPNISNNVGKSDAKELDFDAHVQKEPSQFTTKHSRSKLNTAYLLSKSTNISSQPSSLSGGKSTGSTSALSESVKAKNEERRAKLQARMRENSNKSKPTKPSVPGAILQASSVKKEGPVRKNLAEQIREKALKTSAETEPRIPPADTAMKAPSNTSVSEAKENTLQSLAVFPKTSPPPPSKPQSKLSKTPPLARHSPKRSVLSPMDTYEMTDHEGDSDSDSECEKSMKRVPEWAQHKQLLAALEKQCRKGPGLTDPDEVFGEVQTCNLEMIFASSKNSRFRNRTSSGNWEKDRVTAHEKMAYKRRMGYIA